ncbi:hypothetical protein MKW98_000981 [Papaver atlanticum]|uniref:Uncharacterized protein n=1 Tax=Papaver atlanticum TaxID=357466 RepID=A0AAD4XCP5_9MAGN|nr:hypothetical protein MKW98_000981 [Papaver atlanticum]
MAYPASLLLFALCSINIIIKFGILLALTQVYSIISQSGTPPARSYEIAAMEKSYKTTSFFFYVVIHCIRLPKQSTVGDVINDLKTKVECPIPVRSSGCWKYSIIRSTRFCHWS